LLVLAVFQAGSLARYWGSNPVAPDIQDRARLRILTANVLCENDRYDQLAQFIEQERPEVVGLIEVTTGWIEGLATVRAQFPYRVEAPTGADGIALWFRDRPFTTEPPRRPSPVGWPFLYATFDFAGLKRELWLIHASSPFHRQEARELPALAREIGSSGPSRIVVGDMNSSEGSALFGDFLAATGLRDSRLGFGRQESWPVWSWVRIAIDQAFVSDDLAVVDRRLGPDIGSDHFPMVLDLAPAAGSRVPASAASSSR
jgi:endonuclease/exonuclease/phosphatase (EEP) superfamily protein YafD